MPVSLMADFIVCTVNVRGMQNPVKRAGVFLYLGDVSFHVCFVQEAHLRDGRDVGVFARGWGRGESCWGVGGVHSSGVGILFGDRGFRVSGSFSVVQGRVLVVDATWRGVSFRFVNVYAPAQRRERKGFFVALADVCVTNRVLILGGDFNVSLDGGGLHLGQHTG